MARPCGRRYVTNHCLQRRRLQFETTRRRRRRAARLRCDAMKAISPKILVIDDDSRLRDLLVRYLTEQGFQVQALPDARELDKKLQRDPPHLLVLDLMLPGEDGLAVCRRLRASGETVPIIMLP